MAANLAERTDQGAAAATVRMGGVSIGAAHRDADADDPTDHDGVRRVLQGLTCQATGRGRGQAQGLTLDAAAVVEGIAIGQAGVQATERRGAATVVLDERDIPCRTC